MEMLIFIFSGSLTLFAPSTGRLARKIRLLALMSQIFVRNADYITTQRV